MQWNLPITRPKTLSGLLMVEYLESIPLSRVALRLAGYCMEVIKVSRNAVRLVRVCTNS